MTRTCDVVVLGGGITGLASALRLRSVAPTASVALIDSGPRLGGKVCGEVVENCVVDGGPDLCIEARLARSHAFHELGMAYSLIPVNPARLPTFRRSGGEMRALPDVVTDGLVTMPGGMHDMVKLMVCAIPDVQIRVGTRVVSVERSGASWVLRMSDGTSMVASGLICALPATSATRLFENASPLFSRAAASITYLPMTTVSAAWPRGDVPQDPYGTGFIEDEPVKGALTACTWTTSKIPMRSAHDVVLFRGYIRSADIGRATKTAVGEIASSMGIAARPLWTRAYSWVDALPQYPPDHQAAVGELRRALDSLSNLAFAGAAWDGIGIGDCISSGETAAARIAATLGLT